MIQAKSLTQGLRGHLVAVMTILVRVYHVFFLAKIFI